MSNPFQGLRPALEAINQEAKVLPATGQALEDLMRPGSRRSQSIVFGASTDRAMDVVLESPNRKSYVTLQPLYRTQEHVLRFFLDGSARTFFLGDAVEGNRQTPVHVAQVWCGCGITRRQRSSEGGGSGPQNCSHA